MAGPEKRKRTSWETRGVRRGNREKDRGSRGIAGEREGKQNTIKATTGGGRGWMHFTSERVHPIPKPFLIPQPPSCPILLRVSRTCGGSGISGSTELISVISRSCNLSSLLHGQLIIIALPITHCCQNVAKSSLQFHLITKLCSKIEIFQRNIWPILILLLSLSKLIIIHDLFLSPAIES